VKTLLGNVGIFLALIISCAGQSAISPIETPLPSPEGKYLFKLRVDRTDPANPARTLFIEDARSHSTLFKWPVERCVELVWYPDDRGVAVLDHFGSNEDRILVVSLPSGAQKVQISSGNTVPLGANLPPTSEYSHVYFSNIQWLGPRKIRATVEMYDRLSDAMAADVKGNFEFAVNLGSATGHK
jgi:hypothetical protein